MADEQKQPLGEQGSYGFEDDTVKQSTYHFGGNFGQTFMTKFEFTDKGGKKDETTGEPTAGEALDIIFNINGTDRSYRMFPVTKAFDKDNNEITDPTAEEFKLAQKEFNQINVQIMKCFVDENDIRAALAVKIDSFKQYCGILMGLLPKDYAKKPLDIFMQWQWAIRGEAKGTYLEIPKKVKYGKFICAAVKPTSGNWYENKTTKELSYIDATEQQIKDNPSLITTGTKHPYFSRGEWYMESNFATQQKENGATESNLNTNNGNAAPATGGSANW